MKRLHLKQSFLKGYLGKSRGLKELDFWKHLLGGIIWEFIDSIAMMIRKYKFATINSDVQVQFSHSVVSDSLWPHGLQHTRLPCPSLTPRAYSDPCLLSQWCHPTISSSVVLFSSRLPFFPSIRVFSNESVLWIWWPKYWSFSFNISPSNEYSGLISFRMDWLDLLTVQGTLKSLLQYHNSEASILLHSAFFKVQHTSIHDY